MKLPKYSGRPRKPKLLFIRRVAGGSMLPHFVPGQLIYASSLYGTLKRGDVVVIRHEGMEQVKRIKDIDDARLYVIGDNHEVSTDSRTFGWLDRGAVQGKVIWPKIST